KALADAMAALALKTDIDKPVTRLELARTPLADVKKPDNLDAAETALRESDIVADAEFQTQVQTHCSLEPHGGMVDVHPDNSVVAYGSTQGTFSFRDDLADELHLRPDQVEFH